MSAMPCHYCQRPVVFGKDEFDRYLALDNTVPVYRIIKGNKVEKDGRALVAHSIVCEKFRVRPMPAPDKDFYDPSSSQVS